jgi:hypothetical protein
MSRQSDEDVLLFKSFDSREGSVKCKWPSTIYPIPSSDLADKKRKKEREHGPTKNTKFARCPTYIISTTGDTKWGTFEGKY